MMEPNEMLEEIDRVIKNSMRKKREGMPLEDNKDSNVTANNGWIPVEKELPPFGKRLQATILHHEWISDYDADWVSEEEKTYHPAYTEVCEIYPMGGMWLYNCAEDDYMRDVAYINPIQDLANPVSEIIAWRTLPEPYQPDKEQERTENIMGGRLENLKKEERT